MIVVRTLLCGDGIIGLNGWRYLLNSDDTLMKFIDTESAKAFLKAHAIDSDEIEQNNILNGKFSNADAIVENEGELGFYHNKCNNNNTTKYDGFKNYKYSLCLENSSEKYYFTEKFTDCILSWTIPIYYGCSNIDKYLSILINIGQHLVNIRQYL